MKKGVRIAAILLVFFLLMTGVAVGYLRYALPKELEVGSIELPTDPQRIEHGRYLAHHVSLCVECHTVRDFSKFAGPIEESKLGAGGERFPGEFGVLYSPNITPAGIGKWSDEQLYRAVTTGVSPAKKALFPLMPFHNYGQMDRRDIEDILAYIRTLQPIDNEVPPGKLNFPLNLLVRTMATPPSHQELPSREDTVSYGRYLVNAAACAECHTPKERGESVAGLEYAGGMEFEVPSGVVRSSNITPEPNTGIGGWSREAFLERFKGENQSHTQALPVEPSKFNTIMPWNSYSGLTDEDLCAIYDYLQTVKPVENKVKIFTPGQ